MKKDISFSVDLLLQGQNMPPKNKKLLKAAQIIAEDLHKNHFNGKPGGWPISLDIYAHDVFYNTYKESLYAYLLAPLKQLGNYKIKCNEDGWLICKDKKRAKKKKTKKK